MNFTPLDENDPIAQELSREDEITQVAKMFMYHEGLDDWKFELSNGINTVGWCDYRSKTISYSKRYLHVGWNEIEDTILHEIAHALVGPDVKSHGYEWKAMARKVGARPERCAPPNVRPIEPPKMFYFECPDCKQRWYRHRIKSNMIGRLSRCCRKPLKAYKEKK